MSLSYYYEFTAPAATPAAKLETFLLGVEQFAKSLGFDPTSVLNVPFDAPELGLAKAEQFTERLLHRLLRTLDARLTSAEDRRRPCGASALF